LERAVASIAEQIVRGQVVRHQDVRISVSIDVPYGDTQGLSAGIEEACFARHILKAAAAKIVVEPAGVRGIDEWTAVDARFALHADLLAVGLPAHVVADK